MKAIRACNRWEYQPPYRYSQDGCQKGVRVWFKRIVDQEIVEGVVPLDQEAHECHHHLYRHLAKYVVGYNVGTELSGAPQEVFLSLLRGRK